MIPPLSAPGTFYSLWQLPEHYLLMAPDFTILDASDLYLQVTFKQREQIVGRNVFDVFPPAAQNDWQVFTDSLEFVRTHGKPHTMPRIRYDMQRQAAEGGGMEERYWQTTNFPQLDGQGQLQAILLRTSDITEQYQAEQQARTMQRDLQESQARSSFILEALPVMVWTTRPDGYSEYFNHSWLSFTGRRMEQETAFGWLEGVHPDDRPAAEAAWRQAYESGENYQTEYRLRSADGDYRWVLARGIPRRNADGQVSMWVGCSIDIHDQKQLVVELLQANEEQAALSDQAYQAFQLSQSQRETFYSLLMQAPALISVVRGPQYLFEFVNPPYYELFATDELIGRTVLEVVPEAKEQGFIALLDQVYQTGEPFYGKQMPLQLHRRATGQRETRYFDFTYQALRENGEIVGIFSFAFDVTELVQARQQLESQTPPSASSAS
ncbi:PAS domain-containing protein [Hymenobacter taeanensis]|uniref:histidine kinase n=1 Tax=Hymenobacter taeanensis TaxID=2735321 RepID=A0A6M6BD18_9BACT|nr:MULTISPECIES: PAS domain-containing protein [Hymenobacter]QJX45634.1 PAS domain-containing protein [Hymenobacter taeanensis]UOQ79470.1 PAS domain-containing protein [Hymenobacter sp. 5414T-23]